jgi:hypothetical protein
MSIYRKINFDTHTIFAKFNGERVTYCTMYDSPAEGVNINTCDYDTIMNIEPTSGENIEQELFVEKFQQAKNVLNFYFNQ